MITVAFPPKIRAGIYLGYSVLGIVLGSIQVGVAAANVPQPTWLTVALAVAAFLAPGFGLTAASNTTIARRAAPEE